MSMNLTYTRGQLHRGSFADGQANADLYPEELRVGRFAGGEANPDAHPGDDHIANLRRKPVSANGVSRRGPRGNIRGKLHAKHRLTVPRSVRRPRLLQVSCGQPDETRGAADPHRARYHPWSLPSLLVPERRQGTR